MDCRPTIAGRICSFRGKRWYFNVCYIVYCLVYRIGVAEKGYIMVQLSVHTSAGHSSMPPRESSIGILANAVTK